MIRQPNRRAALVGLHIGHDWPHRPPAGHRAHRSALKASASQEYRRWSPDGGRPPPSAAANGNAASSAIPAAPNLRPLCLAPACHCSIPLKSRTGVKPNRHIQSPQSPPYLHDQCGSTRLECREYGRKSRIHHHDERCAGCPRRGWRSSSPPSPARASRQSSASFSSACSSALSASGGSSGNSPRTLLHHDHQARSDRAFCRTRRYPSAVRDRAGAFLRAPVGPCARKFSGLACRQACRCAQRCYLACCWPWVRAWLRPQGSASRLPCHPPRWSCLSPARRARSGARLSPCCCWKTSRSCRSSSCLARSGRARKAARA